MSHRYSEQEKEFLREYAFGHSYKEIVAAFNEKFHTELSEVQIQQTLKRYGFSTGRTGRFEKGNVPANKGKKCPSKGKAIETQFKKGHVPHTHKPVGSQSYRKRAKDRQGYIWEKVAEPNVWKMKHILEWEKYHGPVPKGKVVIFADGDTRNTDISNLVLASRAQVAVMNKQGIHGGNKEQAEAAVKVAELKILIAKREGETG